MMYATWIFGISIALAIWSLFYRFWHVREDVRFTKEELDSSLAFSLNGCGSSIYGGFATRHPDKDVRVYYVFLSLWFVPLMPIGCVLARKGKSSGDIFDFNRNYEVFGKLPWKFLEIISCYLWLWIAIALFAWMWIY